MEEVEATCNEASMELTSFISELEPEYTDRGGGEPGGSRRNTCHPDAEQTAPSHPNHCEEAGSVQIGPESVPTGGDYSINVILR